MASTRAATVVSVERSPREPGAGQLGQSDISELYNLPDAARSRSRFRIARQCRGPPGQPAVRNTPSQTYGRKAGSGPINDLSCPSEAIETPASGWIEEFGKSEITYLKKTDPDVVSFYAGALEGKVQKPLTDMEQLLAFVREKKDQWGTDGRYTEVSSSFLPDPQHRSCVRYRMKANDHGAVNRGTHEFLTLHTAGRFCTHPDYPDVVVDMYYSARHVPGYDASRLNAEGEAFINSLIFNAPLAQAGDKSG